MDNNPQTPDEDTPIDEQLATLANPQAPVIEVEDDDLTDEELDMLTDSEREAYLADLAEERGEDEDEGEGQGEEEAEAAPAPADPAEDEAARAAEAERRRETDTNLATLEQQARDTEAAYATTIEAYKNGDMDDDEFEAKLKEQSNALAQINYNIGAYKAPMESAWEQASASFLKDNPVIQSEEHFDAFNKVLLDVSTNPRFAGLSDAAMLEASKKRYALELELVGQSLDAGAPQQADPATPAMPEQPKPKAQEKLEVKPASERPSGPPTLAQVPAETIDPNQSHMAQLIARYDAADDPEVRESILMQLPESMQDAFLSHAG